MLYGLPCVFFGAGLLGAIRLYYFFRVALKFQVSCSTGGGSLCGFPARRFPLDPQARLPEEARYRY